MAEDLIQQIVGINGPDDLAESLDTRPSFKRNQLVAKPASSSLARSLQRLTASSQTVPTSRGSRTNKLPLTL